MCRERELERKEISSSYILVLAKRSSWSLVTIHYRKFSPLFFQYKEKLLQFKQFAPGRRLQWNTPNRLIQSSPELICISHIMIMNFSFGLVFPQDPTKNVGVKSVWKSVKTFVKSLQNNVKSLILIHNIKINDQNSHFRSAVQ